MRQKLTERQRKFVLYYEGNASEAAIKAGYSAKTAYSMGQQNLKKLEIQQALAEKRERIETPLIADVAERKQLLTSIARGKDKDSTKAIDILNKMDALYVQKLDVQVNFQNKTDEEVLAEVIADLESRGYKVVPPK